MEATEMKKELNFPLNININDKEQLNYIDQKSQPRTTENSSLSENKSSISSLEQNSIDSKIALISNNKNINKYNLKYLTKYKNIYIPKIFLINYDDSSVYPPKDANTQESIQNNINYFNFSLFFNLQNNNNNNTNRQYLNYGYNFNQWKKYAKEIRNKYDELNDLVTNGKIRLPEPSNELEYLMALPSDFGGLGNLYNENKYQNVKFYDPKLPENKDKKIMTEIKFEKKMVWFPLHPNPESLNKKINPFQKISEFIKNNNMNTNIAKDSNVKTIQASNDIKKEEQNKNDNQKKSNEKDKTINIKDDKKNEDDKKENVNYRFSNKEKRSKRYNNKSIDRKERDVSRSRSRDSYYSRNDNNYDYDYDYNYRNTNKYYDNNYYNKYRYNRKDYNYNKYKRNYRYRNDYY